MRAANPGARSALFLCCRWVFFVCQQRRIVAFPSQTRSTLNSPAPPHKSQKQLQVIYTQKRVKQLLQNPKQLRPNVGGSEIHRKRALKPKTQSLAAGYNGYKTKSKQEQISPFRSVFGSKPWTHML